MPRLPLLGVPEPVREPLAVQVPADLPPDFPALRLPITHPPRSAGTDNSSVQVRALVPALRPRPLIPSEASPAPGIDGIMASRAATPGLSRGHQHLRAPAPAADEGPGQRHRDPCPAASTARTATPGRQAHVHRHRPRCPRRPLHHLPREKLRQLLLLVRPDTIMRWHRNLLKRRHAATCVPKRRGRPPTVRSIRAPVLRLAHENSSWGYRRIHGELAALGIKVAASAVWEILSEHGIPSAPERQSTTSSRPSITGIGRTEPWAKPHRSDRYPNRSACQHRSGTWRSADETDSAEPFISADVPLDQAG